MKITFIKDIMFRVVCWILVLQLINISIDPPDIVPSQRHAPSQSEAYSTNEIESVYELISESLFDHNIPETKADPGVDISSETFDLYCFHVNPMVGDLPLFQGEHASYFFARLSFQIRKPILPPPRFA